MPTTELATVPLIAGSDIGDPDNQASAVVTDCLNTISQQDGFQQQQFGMGLENPGTLQLLITWDSRKKHEEFIAASQYGPFMDRWKTVAAEAPHFVHVDFGPEGGVVKAAAAPVTEVATFYFDGAPPSDAYESAKNFVETCEKESGETVAGWAYGVTHEEIEKDGVKGKGAVLLIGWQSRQEHMDFREKETFKKNIQLLRQNAKGIEMHHTTFMTHVAG